MSERQPSIKALIDEFKSRGIQLWQEEKKLRFKAPTGVFTAQDRNILKENKEAILSFLSRRVENMVIEPDEERRYEAFPLTDVQSAYLLGRGSLFEYGGISCHIYIEMEYDKKLEPEKTKQVWQQLIRRHDMLRAVIHDEGYQEVLKEVPEFHLLYQDTSSFSKEKEDAFFRKRKEELGYRFYETGAWPMFEVALTNGSEKSILHFSIEFLIADWTSIWMLLSEFETLYFETGKPMPELKLTFRDYILAERSLKEGMEYEVDKSYWMERMETLPLKPELPVLKENVSNPVDVKFKRHFLHIGEEDWNKIKETAKEYNLTPTAVVMAAYAAVLERWSQISEFCINLTILNRLPMHEQVYDIVGDFTSLDLLSVNWKNEDAFFENAAQMNRQLFEDLDHKLFSGVEVMREIARVRGRGASFMPYVFTSAIGLADASGRTDMIGKMESGGISQTPQVFIDCQAIDSIDGLMVDWDVREGIFPEGMIEEMFETFYGLLKQLAKDSGTWEKKRLVSLPKDWVGQIQSTNETKQKFSDCFLHEKFIEQVQKRPEKTAIIDEKHALTYGEVSKMAEGLAELLRKNGIQREENVGILMRKCCYQVPAALGILGAGAAYVPISEAQPEARRDSILASAEIRYLITTSEEQPKHLSEQIQVILMDTLTASEHMLQLSGEDTDSRAYIIFTSGTTGVPKGVSITHRGAMNTIQDINRRYQVDEKDSVLGLAQMSFDLSVYDIFGMLSAGGTIVYPAPEKQTDPSHWAKLLKQYNITIWNSVPALLQMLVSYMNSEPEEKFVLDSIKAVFLSGDWIPLHLPDEFQRYAKHAKIVSLGGATEASIWSIFYEYTKRNPDWISIPYGKPLSNQQFYVLDSCLRDCPVLAKGELYIGGTGLATEYIGDKEKTESSFIFHPEKGRLYRTGDMGRWMPDGNIEFLGREDSQVKIKGHRIELGEIEAALLKYPTVQEGMAFVTENGTEKLLAGVVQIEAAKADADTGKHIRSFLKDFVPAYMIPFEILIVEEMPLTVNGKVDRKALEHMVKGVLEGKKERERDRDNALVEKFCEIWGEALGTGYLDKKADFYEHGGDSLIMAQVSGKIREFLAKEPYKAHIPFDEILRQMIHFPTVEDLAEFIEKKVTVKKEKTVLETEDSSKFGILKWYQKTDSDLVTVLIPGGLGTTDSFRYLSESLKERTTASIVGINLSSGKRYSKLAWEEVVPVLADEYVQTINELGYKEVQIVGHSLGALIAIEIGRRLLEQNIPVKDLVLVDIPPLPYGLEDELLLEVLFLSNLGLSNEQVGLGKVPSEKVQKAVLTLYHNCTDTLEKDSLIHLVNNPEFSDVGEMFAKWSQIPMEQRFIEYAEAMKKYRGETMPIEMLKSLFRIFSQSLKASHYVPEPYFGDIRFLMAEELFPLYPGTKEDIKAFWEEICFGDLTVIDVKGNHFTCVEDKKNAEELAQLILQ